MSSIKQIAVLLVLFCGISQAQETPKKDTLSLNEVVISSDAVIGSKFKAKNKSGSTYFISPAELKKFNYDDISKNLTHRSRNKYSRRRRFWFASQYRYARHKPKPI